MISSWTTYEVNPIVDSDFYHSQFEVFGVDVCPTEDVTVERLHDEAAILQWIARTATMRADAQGLRLLCTRHREHRSKEIKPAFRAFTNATFARVETDFALPTTYTQIRTHANASGAFFLYPTRDEAGYLTKLSFAIRVPHSPKSVKSIWSVGGSYNPAEGVTSALFDGLGQEDMGIVVDYLNFGKTRLCHPMFLTLMIVEILTHFNIAVRNMNSRSLYELEVRLGVTRGRPRQFSREDFPSSELESNTTQCNHLVTSLVYQERRQNFIRSMAESIARRLDHPVAMKTCADLGARVAKTGVEFQDTVSNCLSFTGEQIHLTLALQKRANSLLNVINVLIAQRDIRATIELTKAAKLDSSAMKAIAVLTMIFLPATFVSSFFGMNFFVYNTSQTRLMASHNLWVFAAATLPLTLLILVLWACWVRLGAVRLAQDLNPTKAVMSSRKTVMLPSQMGFQLPEWRDEMAHGPVYGPLPGTTLDPVYAGEE